MIVDMPMEKLGFGWQILTDSVEKGLPNIDLWTALLGGMSQCRRAKMLTCSFFVFEASLNDWQLHSWSAANAGFCVLCRLHCGG